MKLAPHLVDRLVERLVDPIADRVSRWAVESQQRSRRNAMIASTALAQRRAELDDVEEFLAALGQSTAREVAAHAAHG
ncbi:hypothetical protein [Nocardioides mangrovi]|uniref:Uncharacterized protein n=1 Tax=Nocardioides mangrovi TaxID=2874580 RepID=A0ABS7U986_9ACTN|nr:hypothetical protein [Nocardioides mangrovi]MBZ5737217.1 hypothetical protein [Nocardioides mangrovi]